MRTVIKNENGDKKNIHKKRLTLPVIQQTSTVMSSSRSKLKSRSQSKSKSRPKSKTHNDVFQFHTTIPINKDITLGRSLPHLIKDVGLLSNHTSSPTKRFKSSCIEDELEHELNTRTNARSLDIDLHLPFLAEYKNPRSTRDFEMPNSKSILTPENDPVLLEAGNTLERARNFRKRINNIDLGQCKLENSNSCCQDQRDEGTAQRRLEDDVDISNNRVLLEARNTLERARNFRKWVYDNIDQREQQNSNSSFQDQRDETGQRRLEDDVDISNNRPIEMVVPSIYVAEVETIEAINDDSSDQYLATLYDFLEDPEFDYDADFDPPENFDLVDFDFEGLTKPDKPNLTVNQQDYKHHLRHLATTQLRLCGQQLGVLRIKALCAALSSNCTVYDLEISEDVIDIQAMQYLVDALQENNSVEQLFLDNNRMGRQPVKLLMSHLDQFDRLFSLSLAGNELQDTDGDLFFNYLATSANLLTLNLSYNLFREEAPEVIGKALVKNTTLASLSLMFNHMREDGIKRFLKLMVKNNGVESLDISWNGIGEEGIGPLCTLLRRNNTLTSLDVSACRLTNDQLLALAGALAKAKTIRNIVIGNNAFSAKDIASAFRLLLQAKGELSVKEIDLLGKVIDRETFMLSQQLQDKKDVLVVHGNVLGIDPRTITDADELASMNPITVLVEFGRILDMGIMELFNFMDKDGSKTLTREEIKAGLQEFDIPLPERSLDLLIRRMDSDGDGEISITDIMTSGQMQSGLRPKDRMLTRSTKAAEKSMENERCRKILRRLIAKTQQAKADMLKKQRKMDKIISKKRKLRKKAKAKEELEAAAAAEGEEAVAAVTKDEDDKEKSDEDEEDEEIPDDDDNDDAEVVEDSNDPKPT